MTPRRKRLFFSLPRRFAAQSLVELLISFALLMIILSGLIEFGFWMLEYSSTVTAARNAARFALNNDHTIIAPECHVTPRAMLCDPRSPSFDVGTCEQDFYCKTAALALQQLDNSAPKVALDPDAGDDIVISAFTFDADNPSVISRRYPNYAGESGYWSFYGNQASALSDDDVRQLLSSHGVANTSSGYVLVEIFFRYYHKLGLPWLTPFVPNPLPLHTYTFMPLYSAAPTATADAGGP